MPGAGNLKLSQFSIDNRKDKFIIGNFKSHWIAYFSVGQVVQKKKVVCSGEHKSKCRLKAQAVGTQDGIEVDRFGQVQVQTMRPFCSCNEIIRKAYRTQSSKPATVQGAIVIEHPALITVTVVEERPPISG